MTSVTARALSYFRIGRQPNCDRSTSTAKCSGQKRGIEKVMANKLDNISFLTGIVCVNSIQPVWRDRDCTTVCGVGSRIQWAAPRQRGSRTAATPLTSRARLFPFPFRWRRRQSTPRETVAMGPEPVREPHPRLLHISHCLARQDCWPMPPAVLSSLGSSGRFWLPAAVAR